MAYKGYLLKIGNYVITGEKFINEASYDVTRQIQDLDSYRDTNGVLHRNTVRNTPITVKFSTRPNLDNDELALFLGTIAQNYITPAERKAHVEVFVPELNEYITLDMYIANPTIKIKKIDNNRVIYEAIEMNLIGY